MLVFIGRGWYAHFVGELIILHGILLVMVGDLGGKVMPVYSNKIQFTRSSGVESDWDDWVVKRRTEAVKMK